MNEPQPAVIRAEKSQRSEQDTPWWWLRGDTYPHRETLKHCGCRWSKRNKAWYYIGRTLPDAVQALIDTPPCSDEEASAILGVDIQPKPQPETPRLHALDETVYARHDLVTSDGQPIPTGTRGKITRLYNRNATHGWSYDVDFEGIGTGWFFERELTSFEPVQGIRITRGAIVPPGAVPPPSDAEIKQLLIEGGHQPQAIESAKEEETEAPKIRIIKPVSDSAETDAVNVAIRQTKAETLPVLRSSTSSNGKRTLTTIGQSAVGELTVKHQRQRVVLRLRSA